MLRGWRAPSSVQLTSQGGRGHLTQDAILCPFLEMGASAGIRQGRIQTDYGKVRLGVWSPKDRGEGEWLSVQSLSAQVNHSSFPDLSTCADSAQRPAPRCFGGSGLFLPRSS